MTLLSVKTSLSLSVLAAVSLTMAGACSDQFADCEEDKTCLDDSGNSSTTDSGDGDTSSGGAESGDGDGDGDGDTGSGGKGDAGGGADGSGGELIDPCSLCKGDTPACLDDQCVECTDEDLTACAQPGEFCSPDNTCVECLDNTHCTEQDASSCDLVTNTCTGCEDNEGCAHLEDTAVCDTESKTCVECTVETEAEQCDLTACNPATFTCTKTTRGTSKACEPCLADSECRTGYHCVPMTYQGPDDATPQDRGGYCLQIADEGCARPYTIELSSRTTLSGATGSAYCGINEALTTCEAVAALVSAVECPSGYGCPEGGECKKVGTIANQCTYKCLDATTCKESPLAGSTCGDGTAEDLDSANFYCGG